MLEPQAYLSNMPTIINAKFGIHDKHFATLATYFDFHKALQFYGGLNKFIRINLLEELEYLRLDPRAELVIRVPTLGFTDPAFDYDIRPWFATPFSLNGFGARKHEPLSSKAYQIYGEDIVGNRYLLCFDESGIINYQKTAVGHQNNNLFTTLKGISFCYTSQQVLQGDGMTPLPFIDQHKGALLLLPPLHVREPFPLHISVQKNGKIIHEKTINFKHSTKVPLFQLNDLSLKYEGNKKEGVLHVQVDAQTSPHELVHQIALHLNISCPSDLHLSLDSPASQAPLQCHEDGWCSRVVYQGLSSKTLHELLKLLIPKHKLEKGFRGGKLHEQQSVFNEFQDKDLDVFYEYILKQIENTSLPIMALADFFATSEELLIALKDKMLESIASSDQMVLDKLKASSGQLEDFAYEFADKLDQLLVLDRFHPNWHLKLLTHGNVDLNKLQMRLVMEVTEPDSVGEKQVFDSRPRIVRSVKSNLQDNKKQL